MEWKVFHRYNKLAREGKTKPLACAECNTVYITRIEVDDRLYLWCINCDSKVFPGLVLYQQLKAVVSEWFIEE